MNKYLFRKILIYGSMIILCSVIQLNYPRELEFKDMIPDFLLVLTVIITYFNGLNDGIAVSVITGSVKCIFAGRFLGLGVLIMLYSAIISAYFLRKYIRTSIAAAVLQIFMISLLYFSITGAVSFLAGGTVYPVNIFIEWWIIERLFAGSVMNLAAALPVAFIVRLIPEVGKNGEIGSQYVRPMEII